MSKYITTYTGLHFDPLAPDMDKVRIEDIAHALSLICRGNGHVKHFFSIGQHCLNCSQEAELRGYGRKVALALLLHDAGEAYFSDVPSPLKHRLPDYIKHEDTFLSKLYLHYLGEPLTEQESILVDEIDKDMLAYDLFYLLGEGNKEELPALKLVLAYGTATPFAEVEAAYMARFRELWRMGGK